MGLQLHLFHEEMNEEKRKVAESATALEVLKHWFEKLTQASSCRTAEGNLFVGWYHAKRP